MWPNDKPVNYNPELVYDNSATAWVAQSIQLPNAGEKNSWLIIVGRDNTTKQGLIYFKEI